MALPTWLAGCAEQGLDSSDPLAVAEAVTAWLRVHRVEERGGYTWPRAPFEGEGTTLDLYSGLPGVVFVLLELYHATGDPAYLQEATEAAFLLQGAYTEGGGWPTAAGSSPADPAIDFPGYYSGWIGAAFVLSEVYRLTNDTLAQTGALMLFDAVVGSAQVGEGPTRAWYLEGPEEAYYDLRRGSAGIGLGLLYAYEVMDFPPALDAAADAGRYLIARARETESGLEWPIQEGAEGDAVPLPGATAHVGLFLARLSEATDDTTFLEAARAAGSRLRADLDQLERPGALIDALRLAHALARVDGDPVWQTDLDRGTALLFDTEGRAAWSSAVDRCCGAAGVGAAVLDLGLTPGGVDSVTTAQSIAADLVARSQPGEDGVYWPDPAPVRTGFMDGAAGIASFFVHLDAAERSRRLGIVAPDAPR